MKIERIDITACVSDPANVRRHDEKNLAAIKGSLVKFGQQTPIVIDARGIVLKGNGTLAAAKLLGWDTIDVVRTELTGTDAVGYAIADNRTGELAAWDDEGLGKTLAALKADGFALDMIGFDDLDLAKWVTPPIDLPPSGDPEDPDESEPELPEPKTVTKRVEFGDVWRLGRHRLKCGDSADVAAIADLMDDEKGHAIVSDPPYGLSFMGKAWDYAVPSSELWKLWLEALRPGAHVLMFSGTRTYHRAVVALEDAGAEVRDQMQWLHGQGFPKSHDVSKAIDREAGAARAVVGKRVKGGGKTPTPGNSTDVGLTTDTWRESRPLNQYEISITAPSTDAAREWDGFGTALKPANEPICVARKPLEGTVAECVQKYGTGALNVDGARIGMKPGDGWDVPNANTKIVSPAVSGLANGTPTNVRHPTMRSTPSDGGRWPANVVLSHTPECGEACAPGCPVRMLDEQSGETVSPANGSKRQQGFRDKYVGGAVSKEINAVEYGDRGGASRFFYIAKPARSERGEGNVHATVKPIRLMEYLVKLVTADGQTVLEPFAGSGTTLLACERTGRTCYAAELDPAHCDIVLARWEALTGEKAVIDDHQG